MGVPAGACGGGLSVAGSSRELAVKFESGLKASASSGASASPACNSPGRDAISDDRESVSVETEPASADGAVEGLEDTGLFSPPSPHPKIVDNTKGTVIPIIIR